MTRRLAGVPILECYPASAVKTLPIILILHGYTGRKEDNLTIARQFAAQGYYAAALDLHLHGELGAQPFVAADVTPRFAEVIEVSRANLTRLVEAYQFEDSPGDGSRIGLLGISLGGAVIHAYLPERSAEIKAAVGLIAGLPSFMDQTFRSIQPLYPHFGVTDDLIEALNRWGHGRPLLENVRDFPLLWQYGQADPIIPIERVREAYQAVRGRYAHPEWIELVEYPNTGHETPAEMVTRALGWFKKFL
jgi:uncharacterized protein